MITILYWIKNTIYPVWSGLVFKMRLNTSQQIVHNNNTYSKVCGLYLSQLIMSAWLLYVYLTKVYNPTR